MKIPTWLSVIIIIIQCHFLPTDLVPLSEFLPFGRAEGDINSINYNLNSDKIVFPINFYFFGKPQNEFYVNVHGVISFGRTSYMWPPSCIPGYYYQIIYPFWSNIEHVNGYGVGQVYYRTTNSHSLLSKVSKEISAAMPGMWNLKLEYLSVITFHNVTFEGAQSCIDPPSIPRNTFQTILATDGLVSFVIFYYNEIKWITASEPLPDPCTGIGGIPASVGFDAGNGKNFFALPGACKSNVADIAVTSNVNSPGKWIFRVDTSISAITCDSDLYGKGKELLKTKPSSMDVTGQIPIKFQGPCFSLNATIIAIFKDKKIGPIIVNCANVIELSIPTAICEAPVFTDSGLIDVEVEIIDNGTKVTYFSAITLYVEIEKAIKVEFNADDGWRSAIISWNPSLFGNLSSVKLDIVMLLYDKINKRWENDISLIKAINNKGRVALDLNKNLFGSLQEKARDAAGYIIIKENNIGNSGFEEIKRNLASNITNKVPLKLTSYLMATGAFLIGPLEKFNSNAIKWCDNWYSKDQGTPPNLPPCPPLESQVRADPRFVNRWTFLSAFYHPGSCYDYRSRKSNGVGNSGQQCTYNCQGNLIINMPGGGTADLISPEESWFDHFLVDVIPWFYCCKFTDDPESCKKYTIKRPIDNGLTYRPPRPGAGNGDPHITTFDDLQYSLNVMGEFWFIKQIDNKSKNNTFLMQSRFEPVSSINGRAMGTAFTAFVMQHFTESQDIEKLQIELIKNGNDSWMSCLLNGKQILFDKNELLSQSFKTFSISASSVSPKEIKISFINDMGFIIKSNNESLFIISSVAMIHQGTIKGLLGNFDGQKENDLQIPNGDIILINSSLEEIHNNFGLKWHVTKEESMFTYSSGKKYENYQNLNFKPLFHLNTQIIPDNVKKACDNSLSCIYDYVATGENLAFALETKANEIILKNVSEEYTKNITLCLNLTDPIGGYINFSSAYLTNSIATYGCFGNRNLVGTNKFTCSKSGEWIPKDSVPTCTDKTNESSKINNNKCLLLLVLAFVFFCIFR